MNLDFVTSARPLLIPRRARLFARIHRPDQLIEGESFAVDLAAPDFRILWGGEVASVARAQLIATHVDAVPEWLWGFANPGIPPVATEELRRAMSGVPELGELLAGRAWKLDLDAALDLADAIAQRTGFEAMYPARTGEATALLALRFTGHHGVPAEGEVSWCLGCGQLARGSKVPMYEALHGRALCATCADDLLYTLADHEAGDPAFLQRARSLEEPPDAPLADVLCAFCERRRPRIMLPETAACWSCLDQARTAFRSAG